MKAINSRTGKYEYTSKLIHGIVFVGQTYLEYGWFNSDGTEINTSEGPAMNFDVIKDYFIFDNSTFKYVYVKDGVKNISKIKRKQFELPSNNMFPYSFRREYESIYVARMFKDKQVVRDNIDMPESKYLKHTYGIEFETSKGYLFEKTCFEDGLMPLRDGSISGAEYTTVVLNGEKGLNLLRQQCEDLKKKCSFNKECSLHIHIGGFPVDKDVIFAIYKLFRNLQEYLMYHVPKYSMYTEKFKKSGKSYCAPIPNFICFEDMYKAFVGTPYMGSLLQNHPRDPERQSKWNIEARYFALNVINAICYDKAKTVEFRFLRPTFNFYRIELWLFIFEALVQYAESHKDDIRSLKTDFHTVIKSVYPEDIYDGIINGLQLQRMLTEQQELNGDYVGSDIEYEDFLFDESIFTQ